MWKASISARLAAGDEATDPIWDGPKSIKPLVNTKIHHQNNN